MTLAIRWLLAHPAIIGMALLGTLAAWQWGEATQVRAEYAIHLQRDAEALAEAERRGRETAERNIEIVTEYVDREKLIEKRVPVVRDRLIRVCDAQGDLPVPSAGDSVAPAGTDAADRRVDLAGELIAARRNQEQCAALIAAVRLQVPSPTKE